MTTVPLSTSRHEQRPELLSSQLLRRNHSIKMNPVLQTINRAPHCWQPSDDVAVDASNPCSIVPSAILFQERNSSIPFDLTQITLESHHDRESNKEADETDSCSSSLSSSFSSLENDSPTYSRNKLSVVTYHHKHVLQYKGEIVCVFQTWHYVNAHGTWGQSMSLRRRGQHLGELQAHILHKGRTATGNGWNAHERRTYRVLDILEASAERYSRSSPTSCCENNEAIKQ